MRPLLVATAGEGSMDRYGQQLAAHLPVPSLRTGVGRRSAERFGVPALGRAARAALRADVAFLRAMRRLPQDLLPHLANHHLARYGPGLGRPYLLTVHDLIRWFDLQGADPPLIAAPNRRDRAALRADERGIRAAAGLVAVSETTRRDLVTHLGIPPERVHVVPEGIDQTRFRPVAPRVEPWPYLLFVGSEHPRKELLTVLRALAALREEHPELRLLKVGSAGTSEAPFHAPVARALDALRLRDRVVFAGHVPDAELPALYAGAAALAFPSRYEGFGLPPLEAMACGCPVVVSDAGSLPEVSGPAALVVPTGDPRALAEALRALLAGGARRAALVARGRAHASTFTWERAARRLEELYAVHIRRVR